MNALKVNYIQMANYSLFSCYQRFRELLLEMPPKPKNAKEENDYRWIVVFQKLCGMSQIGITKYLASGKVQEKLLRQL